MGTIVLLTTLFNKLWDGNFLPELGQASKVILLHKKGAAMNILITELFR